MRNKVIPWLAVIIVVALILVFSVVSAPKEPTNSEMLHQVQEEIGVQGILDYLMDQWSDQEIIEYILDR